MSQVLDRDPDELDLDRRLEQDIEEYGRRLGAVVRHPGYRTMIEELERTPEDQRVAVAQNLACREELERRGVPLPEGFRITLRSFEDPNARWPLQEVAIDPPALQPRNSWTVCGSLGYIACVTVGREV